MGIRLLLLFKEDWTGVHEFIMKKYGSDLAEKPCAHIRRGDKRDLYEGRIEIAEDKPYRSVHYLIRDKKTQLCVEIQVRTLFEEAWGEVDHKLRYPYNLSNDMIGSYLEIMNRASGMADEMGSFLHAYYKCFDDAMKDGILDDNEVYDCILRQLKDLKDSDAKANIEHIIKKAQRYKELISVREIYKEMLKNL